MIQTVDYIVCMPGNPSSGYQALQLNNMILNLALGGKRIIQAPAYSNNIYATRNGCLGPKGHQRDQKPFQGRFDYDRIIWVDSDNIVTMEHLELLLRHNVDIVAGWYRYATMLQELSPENRTACGVRDKTKPPPAIIPYLMKDLLNMRGLVEVDYAGMGLMVMKQGVMESLEYPWFRSWVLEWEDDGQKCAEIVTDDDGLMYRIKDQGFKVWIDPECFIQHQKLVMT